MSLCASAMGQMHGVVEEFTEPQLPNSAGRKSDIDYSSRVIRLCDVSSCAKVVDSSDWLRKKKTVIMGVFQQQEYIIQVPTKTATLEINACD